MNLEPAYTGIKIGDRVELYDWTGSAYVSKWFYIVDDIENYTNLKWVLDNICLQIYQRVNE